MFNICTHRIVFELCLMKKEERRKKKLDEQNRNFHVWFFSTLLKVSGVF